MLELFSCTSLFIINKLLFDDVFVVFSVSCLFESKENFGENILCREICFFMGKTCRKWGSTGPILVNLASLYP